MNLQGGYISRVAPDGQTSRVANSPTPNGGQFNADGHYVVCECNRKAIVAVSPEGEISTLVDQCDGQPFNGPNDVAIDADTGLYFTDPDGSSLDNRIGSVYYVRPDRTVVRADDDLAYPNGINITVDRSAVLVAETLTHRILRYERKDDGTLGPRETFCQLAGGVGPDGMAFDTDANLYVAHYGSARIDVIDPSGTPVGQLTTPGDNPTNCCFGPPGSPFSTSLFVTETATNTVWRYDVGIPGMPLFHLAVASE